MDLGHEKETVKEETFDTPSYLQLSDTFAINDMFWHD